MVIQLRSSTDWTNLPQTGSLGPGIVAIKDELQSVLTDPRQKATFLAATAPHSGDLLNALPIDSCRLRLDDEAKSKVKLFYSAPES